MILGLSLQQLSVLIGVTYQQAHKYERGHNRITAGRLYDISQALGVQVGWLFEGLADATPIPEVSPRLRLSLELARNFALISNQKHREAISSMARALADEQTKAANETHIE
jgi:transcriptional regulator with XRE-family HTH domain